MNTKELDNQYVAHAYGRFDVALTKGQGSTLYDENGKKYIDFGSGIGVTAFGINDPVWTKAVEEQLHRVQHTSNLYYTAPCAKLAQLLCEKSGMKKVFFGNSGAEANEGAIKFARKYSFDKYGAGRSTIITLVNSFHGRTITTLAATGQDSFHTVFDPFTPGFKYCPANDIEALQAAATDDVCAVLFECVQGEGGVVALDADYVQSVADYCHAHDILIIVDEVQTGVGRTGTFLACEQFGLKPDLVTLAKGLGGGLPIGAVLASKKVADTMGPSSHGSTFGGNPVVCAGGCAVLDAMDDAFMRNVNARAAQLREGLASLPHVASVSGMGLMVGIAFADDVKAADVRAACERKGLLVLTAKTRLRLLPPLILSEADVAKALAILDDVLSSM